MCNEDSPKTQGRLSNPPVQNPSSDDKYFCAGRPQTPQNSKLLRFACLFFVRSAVRLTTPLPTLSCGGIGGTLVVGTWILHGVDRWQSDGRALIEPIACKVMDDGFVMGDGKGCWKEVVMNVLYNSLLAFSS